MWFIRMYKAIQVAYYWDGALGATSKRDYQTALDKMQRIREAIRPSAKDLLLEGYLLYALGQDALALERLAEAHRMLSDDSKSGKPEATYLRTYASFFGLKALKQMGDDWTKRESLGRLFALEYEKIDLTKIPRSLKRIFPLRQHPDWIEPRKRHL